MNQDNQILYYKGPIEYEIVNTLIRKLEDKISERNMTISLYKKILVVMIEILENIFKYCDPQCVSQFGEEFFPEIKIGEDKDHYHIRASNPILIKHKKKLQDRIRKINNLDKDAVMQEYKKALTNGKFTEKGGAGLGLLEIAKISGKPLHCSFHPLDGLHETYLIEVTIES